MKTATRKLLSLLDTALAKQDDVAEELWRVLTALRGPDSDDMGIKVTTTMVIRRAAFPKTAKEYQKTRNSAGGAMYASDEQPFVPAGDGHFRNHAEGAQEVLGL